MAARRETRRRYLIYPRFRYQSPTKGDATTRRASATRSHEPSRGTKLLFSVSLLSTSTGARSRSSLSLSSSLFYSLLLLPLSLSRVFAVVSAMSLLFLFQRLFNLLVRVPRHSTLPRRLLTLQRARTRARSRTQHNLHAGDV